VRPASGPAVRARPGLVRAGAVALLSLAACRGEPSEAPPFHLIHDMRLQNKYRPEGASAFFADGKSMRAPVEGTVAQGQLYEDEVFYQGRSAAGFAQKAPIEVGEATLKRGQERFNIYCSPCHDRTGMGRGIVVQRGFPPPVDLTSDRVRGFADGEIFNVMTKGVRNMPSYAAQVPEADRWAIVTWVRVLQRGQRASLEDVPADRRGQIEPEAP
jgi:mono/diheme cytochrome c family protein